MLASVVRDYINISLHTRSDSEELKQSFINAIDEILNVIGDHVIPKTEDEYQKLIEEKSNSDFEKLKINCLEVIAFMVGLRKQAKYGLL